MVSRSPLILGELLQGSTITQEMDIARIFSHKPSLVAIGECGTIFHNGTMNGYLYVIDETILPSDIYSHPTTTMKPGVEWLLRKPLKLRKIAETEPILKELMSEEDSNSLLRSHRQ